MRISVYAIALNEEKFVESFVRSCKDADEIVVCDTGSTDSTVEIAESLGIKVYTIGIKPWRFDTARNAALALCGGDIDVCVSLDLDEIMCKGWREEIERVWNPSITRMQYRFDNGMGNIFNATKIHKRTGYTWHHLCHEMIEIDPRSTETWATTDKILIEHHPDPTKSRGQYLPMLRAAVTENPYSHRDRWYLAREFYYHQDYTHAIKEWEHYLKMEGATWHHERAFALRHIGHSHMALKQYESALKAFRMAVDEARYVRDTWMDLAQACYELKQWQECYYAATQGLTITNREYVFTSGPAPWSWKLHDLAALSAHHLGIKEEAIKHGANALELAPDDARLLKNLEYYIA